MTPNPSKISVEITDVKLGAIVLLIFCLTLSFLIGNIGFQGDDWWIFSWPYWHPFPESIWLYARESLRPLEGVYWIVLFELFGFNSKAFLLSSLLLHASGSVLMGACLAKAFPQKNSLVAWSMLFAFLLPTASNLTYMIHTDNSRLSVLLFWASVLSFQRWTEASQSWRGLAPGIILYLMASLVYENATLLIFSTPLFLWPIYVREDRRLPRKRFFLRLFVGLLAAFVAFVVLRFTIFSGGAVHHSQVVPSVHLIWSYAHIACLYFLRPFVEVSTDKYAWACGALVAFLSLGLLLRAWRTDRALQVEPVWETSSGYVALVGAAVLILGLMPYLAAGYTSELGFHSQSRVYSSATFGAAILAGLVVTMWRNKRAFIGAQVAGIVTLVLMAVFLAGLRNDWSEAAEKRRQLCSSLLTIVPDVKPETIFLFLDLQSYIGDRAVVFQGVEGLREFIRILFHKRDLNAHFLYPDRPDFVDSKGRKAVVSRQGVQARGSGGRPRAPLDKLLILEKTGNGLNLLDGISASDHAAAIDWQGVDSIHSNKSLIISAPEGGRSRNGLCSE